MNFDSHSQHWICWKERTLAGYICEELGIIRRLAQRFSKVLAETTASSEADVDATMQSRADPLGNTGVRRKAGEMCLHQKIVGKPMI